MGSEGRGGNSERKRRNEMKKEIILILIYQNKIPRIRNNFSDILRKDFYRQKSRNKISGIRNNFSGI